jgi:hypothetical protein
MADLGEKSDYELRICSGPDRRVANISHSQHTPDDWSALADVESGAVTNERNGHTVAAIRGDGLELGLPDHVWRAGHHAVAHHQGCQRASGRRVIVRDRCCNHNNVCSRHAGGGNVSITNWQAMGFTNFPLDASGSEIPTGDPRLTGGSPGNGSGDDGQDIGPNIDLTDTVAHQTGFKCAVCVYRDAGEPRDQRMVGKVV